MKRVLLVFVVLMGVFVFMTGAMAEGDADATTAVEEVSAVPTDTVVSTDANEAAAEEATAEENAADETAAATENEAVPAGEDNIVADPAAVDDAVKVVLDGVLVDFDVYGVAPQIVNDRIIVPLRAVFELMGAEVDWDNDTRTVTATKGDTVVVLEIDSTCPTVNGEVIEIDQPAIIINDRTMAPLRFVAEAFGGDVEWNGELRAAFITLPAEAAVEEPAEEAATEDAEEAADAADATTDAADAKDAADTEDAGAEAPAEAEAPAA